MAWPNGGIRGLLAMRSFARGLEICWNSCCLATRPRCLKGCKNSVFMLYTTLYFFSSYNSTDALASLEKTQKYLHITVFQPIWGTFKWVSKRTTSRWIKYIATSPTTQYQREIQFFLVQKSAFSRGLGYNDIRCKVVKVNTDPRNGFIPSSYFRKAL